MKFIVSAYTFIVVCFDIIVYSITGMIQHSVSVTLNYCQLFKMVKPHERKRSLNMYRQLE